MDRVEHVAVPFHPQIFGVALEAPRFLLVPKLDVGESTGEQRPHAERARGRHAGGDRRLSTRHEVTDGLPAASRLLNADQHRDGVQSMMRREAARHLVMRLRDPVRFFETAARDASVEAKQVDQRDVIRIGQFRHDAEEAAGPTERLVEVTPGLGRPRESVPSP